MDSKLSRLIFSTESNENKDGFLLLSLEAFIVKNFRVGDLLDLHIYEKTGSSRCSHSIPGIFRSVRSINTHKIHNFLKRF